MALFIMSQSNKEEQEYVKEKLIEFNKETMPSIQEDAFIPICYIMKDRAGRIAGGINAYMIMYNILYIDVLWIDKEWRDKDLGSKLLSKVEDVASKKGCYVSHLKTFEFQAKKFYEKNGYKVFGVLEAEDKNHNEYFMSKKLNKLDK